MRFIYRRGMRFIYRRLLASRFNARHDFAGRAERRACGLWFRLPASWRHKAVCWQLGYLSTSDRLASREVPTITTQEYMDAMRDAETERAAA